MTVQQVLETFTDLNFVITTPASLLNRIGLKGMPTTAQKLATILKPLQTSVATTDML